LGRLGELQRLLFSPLGVSRFKAPQVWLRVSKMYSTHNPRSPSLCRLLSFHDKTGWERVSAWQPAWGGSGIWAVDPQIVAIAWRLLSIPWYQSKAKAE